MAGDGRRGCLCSARPLQQPLREAAPRRRARQHRQAAQDVGMARRAVGRPRAVGERRAATEPTMAVEGRGRRKVELSCQSMLISSQLDTLVV